MNNPWMADYIAGIAGGIVVVLVGHPFDTTKTRLQTAPPNYYNGTVHCVKHTFNRHGLKGFYSGITSPIYGQMFFRAIAFTSFHQSLKIMAKDDDKPHVWQLVVAGAMTGFAVAFVEAPIDLVKTKLQIQIFESECKSHRGPYSTVPSYISYSLRNFGLRSMSQGLSATIIRNTPHNAIFFPVNELVKRHFAAKHTAEGKPADLKLHERLIGGACAGLSAWIINYPLDCIKSNMMAQPFDARKSWWGTARAIVRESGWVGLTRGIVPCAARAVPACGVLFTTVDVVRDALMNV